jgi:hypothetical protein
MFDKSYPGKIYKLYIDNNEDLIYFGSTKQTIKARISRHNNDYKKYKDGKRNYVSSFILFEYIENNDNCNLCFEVIEEFDKITKKELEKKEGEYIKNNKCVNKFVAGRSKKEYHKDNRDNILKHNKKNYENNKEKIKEQVKKYREENKEKIKELKKKYREENIEKIRECKKNYYENNKDKIREHNKKTYKCEICNKTLTLCKKSRHEKSKEHINNLNNI